MVRGQWMTWLSSVELNHSTAQKFIKAHEQFGKLATSPSISIGVIFELISLPSDVDRGKFISDMHTIPSSGVSKTVTRSQTRALKTAELGTRMRINRAGYFGVCTQRICRSLSGKLLRCKRKRGAHERDDDSNVNFRVWALSFIDLDNWFLC